MATAFEEPILIRQSPVVIIRDLLIVQFAATTIYFLAGVVANYGEIYHALNFSAHLSYEFAKFVAMLLAETLLVGFVLLRWVKSYYLISPTTLTVHGGLFFRDRRIIPTVRPRSVSCTYGTLARLFRYGTLTLQSANLPAPFVLRYIPSPKMYLRQIVEQERISFASDPIAPAPDLHTLLASREHHTLEFKSSFRWDTAERRTNKNLERTALKTIAAFLNSDGGHLVLGVDDTRRIVGLADDYQTLQKKDADGFENHFTNVFKEIIGPEYRRFISLSFHESDGKETCVISVVPSPMPAYFRHGNEEVFFIRTGNSTTALQVSEVTPYLKSRWREA